MSSFVYRGNTGFAGLDHRRAASDGAIYDMRNLSARDLPVLTSRKRRVTVAADLKEPECAIYVGRLFYVDDGAFFDGGERVLELSKELPKKLCHVQNKILIMPDGILYDVEKKEAEHVRRAYAGAGKLASASIYVNDEDGVGNRDGIWLGTDRLLQEPLADKWNGWQKGQYLHLNVTWYGTSVNGAAAPEYKLEGIYRIGAVTFAHNVSVSAFDAQEYGYLYLLEGLSSSDMGGNASVTGLLACAAGIPDMDTVFESGNRLWGAKGGEIFCSALGQPDVWYDFDTLSTSAWRVALSAGDVAEGGCVVAGMPCFFSENAIYKIYGDDPTEFSYARTRYLGIKAGEGASLSAVGERVFYLSRRGICAYAGGAPSVVSEQLGGERFHSAVGGTDGVRYYVHMTDEEGGAFLYVYDPDKGVWIKEDDLPVVSMYSHDGEAAAVVRWGDAAASAVRRGSIVLLTSGGSEAGERETAVPWRLETADYTQGAVIRKAANRLLLRYELAQGGEGTVAVSYEGEPARVLGKLSPGSKRVEEFALPVVPHDHFKIVIWGTGDVAIYALEFNVKVMNERK